jgi:tRNA(fMet)-specific endonuclease VapC
MSLYVLDTDTLTLLRRNHAAVVQHVKAHPPAEMAITVITVAEQLGGWYTQVRRAKKKDALARAYKQLAETTTLLSGIKILTLTEQAIDHCDRLKQLKLKIGINDLRIAAITLENAAILVTRNTRDFQQVPNLTLEDWTI